MMMQKEIVSGNGPWRVIYYDGVAMRVEISGSGRTLVVGSRPYESTCARCGAPIRATSPDNDEMDCCEACEDRIEAERGQG